MIPMPGPHTGLTFHQISNCPKLSCINIAISIQVKHLEGDLKVTTRCTEHSKEKYVVRKGNESTCKKTQGQLI